MKKGLTFFEFEALVRKREIRYPINDLMSIMDIDEAEGDTFMENEIIRAMYKYYIRITKRSVTETNKRETHSRFD